MSFKWFGNYSQQILYTLIQLHDYVRVDKFTVISSEFIKKKNIFYETKLLCIG